jgi:hypothetical protein
MNANQTFPSTTFNVDQVSPPRNSVTTLSLEKNLRTVLGTDVEACSCVSPTVIRAHGFHSLIEAIHHAFEDHRSVILRPDDIWLTIVQGLAVCLQQEPDRFQHIYRDFDRQKELVITNKNFTTGSATNNWPEVFPEFSSRVSEVIETDLHDLLRCDFATTGDIEQTASEIAIINVEQAYYRYTVGSHCGIKSITLEGSPEDWDYLQDKVRDLQRRFPELDWWLNRVYHVADHFASAARGYVNLGFWQHLYKAKFESGGYQASGHILLLIPYLLYFMRSSKNTLVTGENSHPISIGCLPQALSCVPFTWKTNDSKKLDYQFLAGHVAIAYDAATESFQPVMGWAVRPKPPKHLVF